MPVVLSSPRHNTYDHSVEPKESSDVDLSGDHSMIVSCFAKGMRLLIGTQVDLHVDGEAGSATEGYELVANHPPDVCVVAQELEEIGGVSLRRASWCDGRRRCAW